MREINEDYINILELDDHTVFAIIADGCGSKASQLQPASIVTREIIEVVQRAFKTDQALLFDYFEFILKEAFYSASKILGAFKTGNEELYAGFGACVSCVLLRDDGWFAFSHAGNTRIYLIRQMQSGLSIRQLTKDHTKAMKLFEDGLISELDYYSHPDNLVMTSGLGIVADPVMQIFQGKIKTNDFILMTTDGIHYAVRPEPMAQLVMASENCDSAVQALVDAAKSLKYSDNMSAVLLVLFPQK